MILDIKMLLSCRRLSIPSILPHLFTGGSGRNQQTSGMRCNAEAVFQLIIMTIKHFSWKKQPKLCELPYLVNRKKRRFFLVYLRFIDWETEFCASKSVRRKTQRLKNKGVCDPHIFARHRILCTHADDCPKSDCWAPKNRCTYADVWKSSVRVV